MIRVIKRIWLEKKKSEGRVNSREKENYKKDLEEGGWI